MKRVTIFILFTIVVFWGSRIDAKSGINVSKNSANMKVYNPRFGFGLLTKKVNHQLKVEWNNNNLSPVFVGGTLTNSGYASSSDKSVDAKKFLSENKELFGINDPDKELSIKSYLTDNLSMTHIKYQQQINGLKIYDGQIIVHINSNGSIESVNGRYYPTPDINTTPKLDAASAIRIALNNLGNYKPDNEKAELIIFNRDNQLKLTYEVKLPSHWMPDMRVYVSAEDGSILKVDNGIRYDGPVIGSGVDLAGKTQTLHTYLSQEKYFLIDASLPMYHVVNDTMHGTIETYDAQNDTAKSGLENVIYISDPNNDNNFNDNSGLQAAVSAHINIRDVYEFYRSKFGRESFDNKKASIWNVVHYKENYNNAFWNGVCMVFGDGDGKTFSNLAGGFDVTVHEFTHAVTSSTADLIYENQAGALNESISDVFASLADSTNWLIGEDVYSPDISGDALRSMSDPHNGGTGPTDDNWQPANMNEFVYMENDEAHDYGGVHINSGIPNKAFYNVATATAHWKAGLIWYRSLTLYLTKNAQFDDLRNACLVSAKDIFGEGSAEYNAVEQGFNDVGIDGSSIQTTELSYDDGIPDTYVWENAANWALATRFTPTVKNAKLTQIKLYIGGFVNPDDPSHNIYTNLASTLSIAIYNADGTNELPGTQLLNTNPFTVRSGYMVGNTSDISITGDFYIACVYNNNTYQPAIACDTNGYNRAYEYNLDEQQWVLLGEYYKQKYNLDFNFNLYIRAVLTYTTGVTEIDTKIPNKFEISPNYPNPFNPTTSIRYSLPKGENVNIIIYDITGREIATLVNNFQNSGTYIVTWNGKNNSGAEAASGVYLYKIQAGNFAQTRKMVLLK